MLADTLYLVADKDHRFKVSLNDEPSALEIDEEIEGQFNNIASQFRLSSVH